MECLPSVHVAPGSNSSPTHKNIFFLLKWNWGEMRVCQNKPPRSKSHILGSAHHCSFFFRVKSSLPTSLQVLMYLLTKQSGNWQAWNDNNVPDLKVSCMSGVEDVDWMGEKWLFHLLRWHPILAPGVRKVMGKAGWHLCHFSCLVWGCVGNHW